MERDGGLAGIGAVQPPCNPVSGRSTGGVPDRPAIGMAAVAATAERPVRSLIGCGANLGCPREQLNQAIDMLRFMPGIALLEVSQFIETRPVGGPPGQPAYLNAACLIETNFEPEDLLAMLAAIENTLDRRREQRWGPRSIDLDLLLHGDRIIENERLQLPHPRMTTRRFVLEPAAEIAPDPGIPRQAAPLVICSRTSPSGTCMWPSLASLAAVAPRLPLPLPTSRFRVNSTHQ